MLFAQMNGLRSALSAAFNPGALNPTGATTQSPENAQSLAVNGYCSSDGGLIYLSGRWRVVSDRSKVTCQGYVSQSSSDIIKAGYPVYVGPLPWSINAGYLGALKNAQTDLTNPQSVSGSVTVNPIMTLGAPGQQIMTLTHPNQLPKEWGAWFGNAFNTALKSGLKTKSDGGTPSIYPPYFDPNRLVGAVSGGRHIDGLPSWCPCPASDVVSSTDANGLTLYNCTSDPGCFKGALSTPGKQVTLVKYGPDQYGFNGEWVQYAGDPNLYEWFWPADWADAFRSGLSAQPGIGSFLWDSGGVYKSDTDLSHQFFDYDPTVNVPPIAKFRHPTSGDIWGLWVATIVDSNDYVPGAWNVHTDNPNGFKLKIALGPIPSEPWYDYIVDGLEWVAMTVGGAGADLIGEIQNLACTNPAAAAAIAGKDPRLQAALMGIEATCPKPTTTIINCLDPANAANPICKPQAPWWQNPFVLVGGGAIVVLLAILAGKRSKG